MELFPAAEPVMQAILFPGNVIKEVSKVFGACMMDKNSKQCSWARILQFERLWDDAAVTEEAREQWHRAMGKNYFAMSCACTVVALGGLCSFITPVKLVFPGNALMAAVLYYTTTCSIMPNLLLMLFLSKSGTSAVHHYGYIMCHQQQ